jgi:hypothetical protein
MTARRVTSWRRMRAVVIRFSFAHRVSLRGDVDARDCAGASRGGVFWIGVSYGAMKLIKANGRAALGAASVGAVAVGALAVGAAAIGALAIGVLSVRKLRLMEARLDDVYVRRLRVGELEIESMKTPEV